jgi:glycosyltransferase involved in cell wall biosynthesis
MVAAPGSYALVTPARNEAEHIRETCESVKAQKLKPLRWIVVDDGSTDGTADIVRKYQRQMAFLRVIERLDRGYDAVGGGVVEAFYTGLRELDVGTSYIGKLDADITLDSDYYEQLIALMDVKENLGIASGQNYVRDSNGSLRIERRLPFHPVGGARLYRTHVFQEIGGLVKAAGWDTLDIVRTRMRGYDTRNYDDLRVVHLRALGTRGALRDGVLRRGRSAYLLGYSKLYFAARVGYFALTQRPRPLHAWWLLRGYLEVALKHEPPIASKAEREWLRHYQLRRLARLNREPLQQ